jgi:hypothetical protein
MLVQAARQAPQLPVLVWMFVSQPLFGFPSQSAKPAAQVGLHAPATHDVVPFAFVHTCRSCSCRC